MSIYFPTNAIPNECFLETSLKSVTFHGIKAIGEYAFALTELSGSQSMSGVLTLNEVVEIGSGAFMFCTGLTSIYLGSDDLKSIGDNAFNASDERWPAHVYVSRTASPLPTVGRECFSSYMTIHVPVNKVNDYKSAWSEFANQIVGSLKRLSPYSHDGVVDVTEYNVTLNLANYCTARNVDATAIESYSNTLTASNGFVFVRNGPALGGVVYGGGSEPSGGNQEVPQAEIPIICTITMGEDDISAGAFDFNTGEISIEEVTGDITVTVEPRDQLPTN